MKKYISIFYIFLIVVSCSKAKEPENNWDEMNLNGKVRSLKEQKYIPAEKNDILPNGKLIKLSDSSTIVFNSQGNIIEKSIYKADGTLKMKTIYTYDYNGRLTEQNGYKSGGTLEWGSTYKYDSNGKKIEQ